MKTPTFALAACAALLGGCTMVRSVPLDTGGGNPVEATVSYALPRLYVGMDIARRTDPATMRPVYSVVNDSSQFIADPDHVYALSYSASPLSNDTLDVSIDANTGFVTALRGQAEDKTFEAAAKATELTGFTSGKGGTETDAAATVVERLFFDPHTDLDAVNARLAEYGLRLDCIGCRPPVSRAPSPVSGFEGVLYRPFHNIILRLTQGPDGRLVDYEVLRSPNGSRLAYAPLRRSLGVTRDTEYKTFEQGAPIVVTAKKPSEALGVATGIVGVAGALVAAPVAAFTREIESDTKETEALNAERTLIQTRAETELARANADAAAAAAATPVTTTPQTTGATGATVTNGSTSDLGIDTAPVTSVGAPNCVAGTPECPK